CTSSLSLHDALPIFSSRDDRQKFLLQRVCYSEGGGEEGGPRLRRARDLPVDLEPLLRLQSLRERVSRIILRRSEEPDVSGFHALRGPEVPLANRIGLGKVGEEDSVAQVPEGRPYGDSPRGDHARGYLGGPP